jgi:hypothetical protein
MNPAKVGRTNTRKTKLGTLSSDVSLCVLDRFEGAYEFRRYNPVVNKRSRFISHIHMFRLGA